VPMAGSDIPRAQEQLFAAGQSSRAKYAALVIGRPGLGALLRYITDPERKRFQPMNVNFGLLPPLEMRLRGKAKKEMHSQRALADLADWLGQTGVAEFHQLNNTAIAALP